MGLAWKELLEGDTNPASHKEGDPYRDWIGGREGDWVEGAWRWVVTASMETVVSTVDYAPISGAQTAPIRRTFLIPDLPWLDRYEIQVENLSADHTSAQYGDDCYLNSVREILYDQFEYPRHVLVGIRALASDQLSGVLRFSCLAECALVRVYDDVTETWSVACSDNPAWVAFDILTQPVFDNDFNVVRYDGMNPARLILADWVEWADFCDTLVPDGAGGTEKRITFNGGFDIENNMWEAAIQVCQVGRAIFVWRGVNLGVVVDKPGTAGQLFTVGNIGKGSFKETFLPIQDRAAELEIDFLNAANDFQRDKLTVFNPAIDSTVNKVSMQLFGITKASEAWRAGLYRLACNQYILRSIEKEADIDSIACTLGDVINVQHDVPQWGEGGRIVAADETSVTIDKTVTVAADKHYGIMIRLATDAVVKRNVTNVPGSYTVLTVSSPFDPIPTQFDVYAFGKIGKIVKPFRVMNIRREQGTQKATLMLAEYNASIYLTDFEQPAIPTRNYSSLVTLPAVLNLLLDELILRGADGAINDTIDVFFDRPNSSAFAYAEIWHDCGAGWVSDGKAELGYLRIPNVAIGVTYTVAALTVNYFGQKQSFSDATKATLTTMGKLDPPSTVTGFQAKQNGGSIEFSWSHILDADLWGYELRQGVTWEAATIIATGIQHDHYALTAEFNGTYRYWIKSIDASDLYSLLATYADLTLINIDESLNVVTTQDEMTKTPTPADGTIIDMIFVPLYHALMFPFSLTDGDIPTWTDGTAEIKNLSDGGPTNGAYVTDPIDLGRVDQAWIRLLVVLDAVDMGATDGSYPTRTDNDYPMDTDGHITMPTKYALSYALSDDDIAYGAYQPYKGAVQETFQYLKVKMKASIASRTGRLKVTSMVISLDVVDRRDEILNVAIAATTGTDIAYSTAFYVKPFVRVFVKSSSTSKMPSISSETVAGCHVDLIDPANAKVSGTVDLEAISY
jgi:hypothetical protein